MNASRSPIRTRGGSGTPTSADAARAFVTINRAELEQSGCSARGLAKGYGLTVTEAREILTDMGIVAR